MKAYEIIERHVADREGASDAEILAELAALEPLPPEKDAAWEVEATWERARLFVALADLCGMRRLRPGALLLLERACYGDPGEMMRGLRHQLEGIFDPDWKALAEVCVQACESRHAGARLWAVNELLVLRDPSTVPALKARLDDPAELVREEAEHALKLLTGL